MRSVAAIIISRAPTRLMLLALCALAASSTHAAASTEAREFSIEVDGKPAGQYQMTITRQESGILSVRSQANLTVKTWLITYEYSFEGTEHWKDGRVLQLTSKCNDDGTRYEVFAQQDGPALRVRVNGKERKCRGDVWTTSYWMLADKRYHNQNVPLFDSDSGKEYVGHLLYVGVKQINVAGEVQNCYQFRISGGPTSPVDLYYDGQHRLVRQEFTDQGKRIVFHLLAVKR
jgi:hypothetical protein